MPIDKIAFLLPDLSVHNASLVLERPGQNECTIQLNHDLIGIITKTSADYFSALLELRKELDARGIKLLCWGARPDVWPTGFQADCTKGVVATRFFMQPPHPPTNEGTKIRRAGNIFAPASPDEVGTVEDLIHFRKLYFEATKRRDNP